MLREEKESVIVVLEGAKASVDDNGVAAIRWALREVVEPTDDLMVLTIINPKCNMSLCCRGNQQESIPCPGDECMQSFPCKGDEFIQFLKDQIGERREDHRRVLRPYYDICKSIGVKFQVKVAVGIRPKAIVSEEAKCFKATWIIMDRCFGRCLSLCNDCNITLVDDNEEAKTYSHLCPSDGSGSSRANKMQYDSMYQESENSIPTRLDPSSSSGGTRGYNDFGRVEREARNVDLYDNVTFGRFNEAMVVFREPLNLDFEEVLEITNGFQSSFCIQEEFEIYEGFLNDPYVHVMVKRFICDSDGDVEAEKRVTSSMFHRNILGLTAYHESINGTCLVYGFAERGTLNHYLYGYRGLEVNLTFQNRMKIAIEVGGGLRYMHEECPQGPVIHGDLQPYNIFLTCDFQPLISGFGQAKWLSLEQLVRENSNSQEAMELVKSDVFAFGVLLLRLFCQRSLPMDDKHLIELARPLLWQGAFHELVDQEMEDLDMYGFYRIMSAATLCTKSKPLSRPTMTQVVSILRGDNFCAMGSSPSSDGSIRGGNNLVFC